MFLKVTPMTNVTQILSQIERGDPSAAEQLLPLVYDELRKLAAAKLAHEKPGQTLQATALVHEAYRHQEKRKARSSQENFRMPIETQTVRSTRIRCYRVGS